MKHKRKTGILPLIFIVLIILVIILLLYKIITGYLEVISIFKQNPPPAEFFLLIGASVIGVLILVLTYKEND